MVIEERTAAAETVEAAGMRRLVLGAPAALRAELGVAAAGLGGGTSLAMARDPSGGYWNKTLGIGVTEPVTRELVEEVVAFYTRHGGDTATVQIAPALLPADWSEIAADAGLRAGHPWVKLARSLTDPVAEPPATALRTGVVEPGQLPEWAHTTIEGFGMSHQLDDMLVHTRGEAFRQVAAWDGDRVVAAALLFLAGDTAQLFAAATLPGSRGRGAQSALIALRLRLAREAGASWVFAETGVESAGQHNSSLHNLRRAGFTDLYERPNWVWQRPAAG